MRTMLRTIAAGGLVAMTAGSGAAPAGERDPLSSYRWTSRVVVISAPRADDPRLRAQREVLAAVSADVVERDLVTVEAVGRDPPAEALRRRLRLPGDRFAAVLVGKDGGAKLSSDEPIPSRILFSTIDAMPMRRDEIEGR